MSFRTLFDIPFGIPNVYLLAPEKPLPDPSPVGRGQESHTLLVFFQPPLLGEVWWGLQL